MAYSISTNSDDHVPQAADKQDNYEWVYDPSLDSSLDTTKETIDGKTPETDNATQGDQKNEENFFLKHIALLTFFLIVFFTPTLIIFIILWIINFQNKREEIAKGIRYYITTLLIIFVVGLGACLVIVSL
jgi:hypothetical protein